MTPIPATWAVVVVRWQIVAACLALSCATRQPDAEADIMTASAAMPVIDPDSGTNAPPRETRDAEDAGAEAAPTAASSADADVGGAPARASRPPPATIRVAIYDAPGVSAEALQETAALLARTPGFAVAILTPDQVRTSRLAGHHVIIFTGGRGSEQGRLLGEEGRRVVRAFLARGGGYIGVCAGAYLAIQGREEFHKIEVVAARHLSGDFWRRGVATVVVREIGAPGTHGLFYANGPIFEPVAVRGLQPYRPLATFESDVFMEAQGTRPGEMPGTPAIIASAYRSGRVLLFSPNPVLAAPGERDRGDMMLDAVRWVATRGHVPEGLRFGDVFHGTRERGTATGE
jgi:hypothetical protein